MEQIKNKKIIMKTLTIFTITCLFAISSFGQVSFGPQQIISTSAGGAYSVYACDIDGDGDMDVLSASESDDKIAWYENTDGNGTFGTQQIISNTAYEATSVFACDIDGDGDLDVISGSRGQGVAWYENTDGNGTFGTQQIITSSGSGGWIASVYAADIDNDGDIDVVSGSTAFGNNTIEWYENTDAQGNFGSPQPIITSSNRAYSVFLCDIDGDNDNDLLAAISDTDGIVWFENTDNQGTFGAQQVINDTVAGPFSVYACDIDNDGIIDVLSASHNDNKIAWYKNNGGGNFGYQQIITTNAIGANSVYACDIDSDGDNDVLSASDDDKIAWYENTDGNGTFATQQVISTLANGPISVYACDIDSDGDNDVLSASWFDNEIAWYENNSMTNINIINNLTLISIYPNPTKGFFSIKAKNIEKIEIANSKGQIIKQIEVNGKKNNIDLSLQAKGFYFVKVITSIGIAVEKVVVE